jgi:dCTP deaminase
VLDDAEPLQPGCTPQQPLVDQVSAGDFAQGLASPSICALAAGDLVGYRAKPHTGVVDLDRIASLPGTQISGKRSMRPRGRIILDPGAFYILVSREAVTIPPDPCRRDGPVSGHGG